MSELIGGFWGVGMIMDLRRMGGGDGVSWDCSVLSVFIKWYICF